MSKRYCLALDLKDDPQLIAEYERHHEEVWPEILKSIREAGIDDMEIYRVGTRMFMIIEGGDGFSFASKAESDKANPKVQEWERLMWKFQKQLPESKPDEKWMLMRRIFKLAH